MTPRAVRNVLQVVLTLGFMATAAALIHHDAPDWLIGLAVLATVVSPGVIQIVFARQDETMTDDTDKPVPAGKPPKLIYKFTCGTAGRPCAVTRIIQGEARRVSEPELLPAPEKPGEKA